MKHHKNIIYYFYSIGSQMKICLIVDGYSTGKHIAPALLGYGFKCVHIQSSPNLPKKVVGSFQSSDYIKTFTYQENINDILHDLGKYKIMLCVAGSESGVELADLLCEKLALPGNGTAMSSARRNKFEMIESLSKTGLKTASHLKSDNLSEIQKQIAVWNSWPIVLKPVTSANNDNVYICQDYKEVTAAFNKIISAKNLFGVPNKSVLVETYNDGDEYIVNTVSWEGSHALAEIWKVTKVPQTIIYDTCEILQSSEKEYMPIVEYTRKVLDGLNVRYGAGTTELKYGKNGPVIIECATRLMANAELSFSTIMFGINQLTLLLEAYLATEQFLARLAKPPLVTNKLYGLAVLLLSDTEGVMQEDLSIEQLLKLESLHSYEVLAKGDKLSITVDNNTCPGVVYLMHPDRRTVLAEGLLIRKLEKSGFYKNALISPSSAMQAYATHGFLSLSREETKGESSESYILKKAQEFSQTPADKASQSTISLVVR